MEEMLLYPIAYVSNDISESCKMPLGGVISTINILPQYLSGLKRIEESSHLWILSWFHQARRDVLNIHPKHIHPDLPVFGVFALRAFGRPNPLALTLVRLIERKENALLVEGLDAIDGTPIVDIKPYFQSDIIFSPRTSYLPPHDQPSRINTMRRRALGHHREECVGLWLGLRMAAIAETELGHLHDDNVSVSVSGSPCLADTLQVLSTARFANPPRFTWKYRPKQEKSAWKGDKGSLILIARREFSLPELQGMSDKELFIRE